MRLESHGDGIHRYEEHVCRGHYLMQKRWSRLTPVPTLGVGNRSSPLFKDGTIRHGELRQLASSLPSRKQQVWGSGHAGGFEAELTFSHKLLHLFEPSHF